MGQRHQLFVIAKIRGRYRTLCAIHHQWLYGHTALKRCRDTLNIFGDATNRMPIQQELHAASEKGDGFWMASTGDDENSVPFPFIATCLIMGASFNVDDVYHHSVSIESLYMQYDEGDNNNGITIFDITELTNVRYCFVDFMGMESEREVELNTPLSARTYLEAYYDLDEPDDRAGLKPLLKSFEGRSLVTHAALADTWPDGDWQEPELIEEEAKITTQLSQLRGLEDTQGDNLKSLRDRSMDVLLESLLDQTEDNPHLMAEAELMSDFIPKLRAKFYVRAASLKPSSALIRLLCRALENEVEVDLSPFKTLTVDDLTAVVAILRKSKMKVLNLSDMPNLEESDLGKILGFGVTVPREIETGVQSSSSSAAGNEIRSLRALTLLENPQISLQYLTQYLGNYEIYHSELFRRAIRDEYYGATTIPSLEFVAPNIVSQLVFIGIAAYQTYDPKYRLENGQFEWKTMEHLRGPVRTLGSDKPFGYNQHLLDIPLPAPKMIECLMRVLQFFSFPSMTRYESWSPAAAPCFAKAFSGEIGSGHGIGPLSFNLSQNHHDWRHEREPLECKPLKNDQWAIILVHEAFDARDQESLEKRRLKAETTSDAPENNRPEIKSIKRLRYALAKALPESMPSQKAFIVTDVPGYLEQVLRGGRAEGVAEAKELSEWWKSTIFSIKEEVSYYGDDDIYEILERVYSRKGPVED